MNHNSRSEKHLKRFEKLQKKRFEKQKKKRFEKHFSILTTVNSAVDIQERLEMEIVA